MLYLYSGVISALLCAWSFFGETIDIDGSPRRRRLVKFETAAERNSYLRLVRSRPVPAARDHHRALGSVFHGVVQGDAAVRVGDVYADALRYQLLHAKDIAGLARTEDAGA